MEKYESHSFKLHAIDYGKIIIPEDKLFFDCWGNQIPNGEYFVTEVMRPKFGTGEVGRAKKGFPYVGESEWRLRSLEGVEYIITSRAKGGEWLENNKS